MPVELNRLRRKVRRERQRVKFHVIQVLRPAGMKGFQNIVKRRENRGKEVERQRGQEERRENNPPPPPPPPPSPPPSHCPLSRPPPLHQHHTFLRLLCLYAAAIFCHYLLMLPMLLGFFALADVFRRFDYATTPPDCHGFATLIVFDFAPLLIIFT